MTDLISRLANRRCPDCLSVQPLYTAPRPNSRRGFLRGGKDVVPCPGCAQPLRLLEPSFDPHGIVAAIVFVVTLTGGVFAMIPVSARAGWSAADFALAVAVGTVAMVLLAMGWNILRARGRDVVRADPAAPDPTERTETPR